MLIVNRLQIVLGAIVLMAGTLMYMFVRVPEQTYFIGRFGLSLYDSFPYDAGVLTELSPSFFHVFSFILLTAGVAGYSKMKYLAICFFWFSVNIFFELGQKFSSLYVEFVPDWFDFIPVLQNTSDYFRYGTYDVIDMTAIVLGTCVGFLTIMATKRISNYVE